MKGGPTCIYFITFFILPPTRILSLPPLMFEIRQRVYTISCIVILTRGVHISIQNLWVYKFKIEICHIQLLRYFSKHLSRVYKKEDKNDFFLLCLWHASTMAPTCHSITRIATFWCYYMAWPLYVRTQIFLLKKNVTKFCLPAIFTVLIHVLLLNLLAHKSSYLYGTGLRISS